MLSRASELQQSEEGFAPVFFNPRPLTCLVLIDEMESLMPVTHMEVSCPQAANRPAGFLHCCHGVPQREPCCTFGAATCWELLQTLFRPLLLGTMPRCRLSLPIDAAATAVLPASG